MRLKMLFTILPCVVLAMIILTAISSIYSKDIIESQIQETMDAELRANMNQINSNLDSVRTTAVGLASTVSGTYQTTPMEEYRRTFSSTINASTYVNGAGIWFEPYAYSAEEEYMGPYWYKDGDEIVETYDYSNAEYDYFVQDYYTLSKDLAEGETLITDPYYDETSDTIMATCVAPIYDGKKFIGCVSSDIVLDTVEKIVGSIKVSNVGTAMLTDSLGTYLYTNDADKIRNAVNIAEDENPSLAKVGKTVLANETGITTYKKGKETYNVYYATLTGVNWKLLIQMPQSSLLAPVKKLRTQMIIICIITLILCSIVVLLQVNSISKSVVRVKDFAVDLAKGDFTTEKIQTKREDELGQMSDLLNEMYENNRDVISQISVGSAEVSDTSEKMSGVAKELTEKFRSIQSNMVLVNDAMTSTGAATEEVSASVQTVNDSVTNLASEVTATAGQIAEIKERASSIENDSKKAYDSAVAIVDERGNELAVAREKSKVVSEIGNLANTIADIADQITLLALNASIEAARAGEAGRGFAVVADEINALASETASAVEQIQMTINGVQDAFSSLDGSASELVSFLEETVTPDYDKFVDIGRQYGSDAEMFAELFSKINEMVEDITLTMDEVTEAVASIAESAQDTANSSSEVTETVTQVSETVDDVTDMAENQEHLASNLSDIVGRFKLKD